MAIAVVTGGAGDIGTAICEVLGAAGYTLAVADLTREMSDKAAAALVAKGYDAFGVGVNITQPGEVDALAAAVLERGEVAAVINNAGVASAPDFESGGDGDWLSAQAINLNGAYFVTTRFLPAMVARGKGVIVNVSSGNGLGYAGNPAYSVAKAGLIHLTRMLAVEYGPKGIRAVSIVPGSVRTKAWAHRLAKNPKLFDELRKWYPLGRIVEPVEVANVVAFAVSDLASAITGSTLTVDNGILAGNTVFGDAISSGDRT